MTLKKVYVLKNRYVDSVTLMNVAEKINQVEGIFGAESDMGTPANVALLSDLGYDVPQGTGKNDLIIAIDADPGDQERAYQIGLDILDHRSTLGGNVYSDVNAIDLTADPYDLVQISLPGEYAAAEIRKALDRGLDCFVFSDNVSLEDELACKQLGREKGRLVMGPDAGVGLLGGVALAAGSIVRKGAVGIIGASGSGAQEVACLVEHMGQGVSCIIGTGGRDLSPQIGGITMLMALERLANDPQTQVICLVSKVADPAVMGRVLDEADKLDKPVTAVFLGAPKRLFDGRRVHGAWSLEEAAVLSVAMLGGEVHAPGRTRGQLEALAAALADGLPRERRYLRGLYCGGTFTEEAMILFHERCPQIPLYSNLDTVYASRLDDPHRSKGHAILDLGAEEFTAEAPHPIFDPALRLRRLEQELADGETGVVVLDFITGPGVHADPIMPFVPVIQAHPEVRFIAAICGAEADPQDISGARRALEAAGCVVTGSNYQSAWLAAAMLARMEGRR